MPKPTNCISVAEGKQLQANWTATRAPELKKLNGGVDDVNAVTFNIDQLQQFIDYVKEESQSQGILAPGIRVYFAAYNDTVSKKSTVFLCGTSGDSATSSNNYNVDPLNFGSGLWPPHIY